MYKQMWNTRKISHEPVLYKAHQTQYDKVYFLSNEEFRFRFLEVHYESGKKDSIES